MQAEPTLPEFEQAVSCWTQGGSPHEIEQSWLVPHCPFLAYARRAGCDLPPTAMKALESLTNEQQTKHLFAGQPSELLDAASRILHSISDGATDPSADDMRALALLMSGLAHTVSTAVAVVDRNDASTQMHSLRAMTGLSQAWPVDVRDDWQPGTALPDSLTVGKPDTSTRLLYTLAAEEGFQQAANAGKINLSGWLMFERLLRYLLKEDAEDEVDEHQVTAPVLLYNRKSRLGHVCPFQIRANTATLSGAFIDPLASGLMIGDAKLIQSLQYASRIARGALLRRAQDEKRPVALRLCPKPPRDFQGFLPLRVEGASGGRILACGLNAAAERRPLNRKATATAQLLIEDDSAEARLLWNDQIRIDGVLKESVPAKFKAARRQDFDHVAMAPEQAAEFRDHKDAKGLNVVRVSTYRDCYEFLTSDADLDDVLYRYGEAVVQHWQEDAEQTKSEHRIDRFVDPSLSLMPEGRTPFDRQGKVAQEAGAENVGEHTYKPIQESGEAGHFAALESGVWQCWIEDAGAGKSVFAWKTQTLLSSAEGQKELFQGKPCLAVWWEGHWPEFEKKSDGFKSLATALQDELLKHDSHLSEEEAEQTVKYALSEGRVVLIIDALDQFTEPHLRWLKRVFANEPAIKNCRMVLTSRAYKVHDEQTFFKTAEWRYGRIDGFTTDTQRDAYFPEELRTKWREMIPEEDEVREGLDELLRSPLVLRMILEILEDLGPDEQPKPFHNRGDLYWEVAKRLLRRAVDKESDDERIARYDRDELLGELRRVISTIAVEMMLDKDRLVSESRRYAIAQANVEPFLQSAKQRYLRDVPDYEKQDKHRQWLDALAILKKIEFRNRDSMEVFRDNSISFRSLKSMEFYTGLYLANHATKQCATEARRFTNSDRWHWAWRFAIELPPEARQPHVLCRSLAQLFERPEEGLRPTELMFRCWPLFETEPFEPIRRQLPESRPLPGAADVVRRWRWQLWDQFGTADEFQREEILRLFPEQLLLDFLASVDDGSSTAIQADVFDFDVEQRKQLGRWLTQHRETLVARSQADRQCATADQARAYYRCPSDGNVKPEPSAAEPFLMQSFTVTEAQYAAFEPWRDDWNEVSVRDTASDQPAVDVTWFGAWMFSKWVGGAFRLPMADESETACRAGSSTEFWWGPDFDASHCNASDSKIGRTLGRRESSDGYQNDYGLYHMAGNVWQWCWDPAGVGRVLRGGGFFSSPRFCRSSRRRVDPPSYHGLYLGFRVVCCVG